MSLGGGSVYGDAIQALRDGSSGHFADGEGRARDGVEVLTTLRDDLGGPLQNSPGR
jgi:hypothetical protein